MKWIWSSHCSHYKALSFEHIPRNFLKNFHSLKFRTSEVVQTTTNWFQLKFQLNLQLCGSNISETSQFETLKSNKNLKRFRDVHNSKDSRELRTESVQQISPNNSLTGVLHGVQGSNESHFAKITSPKWFARSVPIEPSAMIFGHLWWQINQ